MLKRRKFPPLIKARALSMNCTMGNLAMQHACIQSMLNLPRFISFLLYKSLGYSNVQISTDHKILPGNRSKYIILFLFKFLIKSFVILRPPVCHVRYCQHLASIMVDYSI